MHYHQSVKRYIIRGGLSQIIEPRYGGTFLVISVVASRGKKFYNAKVRY
jgi:hypothetical protein